MGASDSLSDLHANRIRIQFSVRFPVWQQSTPILEIINNFFFGKQQISGKTIQPPHAPQNKVLWDAESDKEIGGNYIACTCRRSIFVSVKESFLQPICIKSDEELVRKSDAKCTCRRPFSVRLHSQFCIQFSVWFPIQFHANRRDIRLSVQHENQVSTHKHNLPSDSKFWNMHNKIKYGPRFCDWGDFC
jgi:hypothetical protein